MVLWRGEAAAAFAGGTPFAPRVRLYGELGPAQARERAARRLEAFLAAEAGRRLGHLRRLEGAVASGKVKGLARGLAYRLIEAGGVLDRDQVRADAKALSVVERRALKALGVRLGAFSLYLPALLKPPAQAFAQGFTPREGRPQPGRLNLLPQPHPTAATLAAFGLQAVGRYGVPVDSLERLDALLRSAAKPGQLSNEAREELGWSEAEARDLLRALNFVPTSKAKPGEAVVWRRRGDKPRPAPLAPPPTNSPFAALAALKDQPPPARRPRKRRRKAKAAQA